MVSDYFCNNILYRPTELEHTCCYEQIMCYELKKIQKKKKRNSINDDSQNPLDIESDDDNTADIGTNSETIFALTEEHPSHKYMALHTRKRLAVPMINVIKILPNVTELLLHDKSTDSQEVKAKREQYAQIALLLFHPFRIHSDLTSNNSYWKKYQELLEQGKFWKKGNEILQNLQDVIYNCSCADIYSDPLITQTVLNSCPEDKDLLAKLKKDRNQTDINDYEKSMDELV